MIITNELSKRKKPTNFIIQTNNCTTYIY